MTDREKLVKLLDEAFIKAQLQGNRTKGYVADQLLANGVTVREMIPITEEVPDENCLAVNGCGTYMVGKIVKDPYLSAVTGYSCMRDGIGITNVTHWMSLPKAKKEEQP